MRMFDRETIQKLYIRICRDSGFSIDYIQAAILAGKVLNMHPFSVYNAFSYLDVMEKIAKGEHPVVDNPKYNS